MELLFIDTETGGIDENVQSLLSVGLIVWKNGEILEKDEFFIKEENYKVTKAAMDINKLNLDDVYKKGILPSEAVERVVKIIQKYFKGKAILCGHNVNFDVKFLKKLFEKVNKNYDEHISYRSLDTASILKFLSIANKFEEKEINSLDDAIDYFNIDVKNRHTALEDINVTVEIFNKLIELV